MAEKTTQEVERIYTIPLREVKASPRNHQADRAVRAIKTYLTKHLKADSVWIDAGVNEHIWARGMYTIPSRIRVRARKFDDGVVEVTLPELEQKGSIREGIKQRREAAEEKKEKTAAKKEPEAEKKEEGAEKKEPTPAGEKKPEAKGPAKHEPSKSETPKPAAKPEAPAKPGAPKHEPAKGKA